MTSPFPDLLENCTLRFSLSNTGTERDLITGNLIVNQSFVEFVAFLKEDTKSARRNSPGVDFQGMAVFGYLIRPQWFPANIKDGSVCDCEWQDTLNGTAKGRLTLRTFGTPTSLVNEILGDRFRGDFVISR